MTDAQIGWLVAMATGAMIGALTGLVAMIRKSPGVKLWFSTVLGMVGAIMVHTVAFIAGMAGGVNIAAATGLVGAIAFLSLHHLTHGRRRWARW